MKIVILIPALNEGATIGAVVNGAMRYGLPLVVDDGSTDDTAAIAESEGAHVVSLAKNAGYENALEAGFAEAERLGANVVVTFDADGQFAPALLKKILSPILDKGVQLVIGERSSKARLGEVLFGIYTRARFGVSDIFCGVKAYQMPLYRAHGRFDEGRSVGTELALGAIRSGARFETVILQVGPRKAGRPRFGSGLRANLRLLTAMRLGICADVKALWR